MTLPNESWARFQTLAAEKPELFEPLKTATDIAAAADLLAKIATDNGLDLPADQIRQGLDAAVKQAGEMSDADLDAVAGGASFGVPNPGVAFPPSFLFPFFPIFPIFRR
ncbi:hypothetical protein [Azospirillum thermophilum]|uniref:Nif11 domain-containing protein n=1 Tax=Azospirillum thermophilum TaxID=2202148 RepID=A0A2S2CWC4_9PROT|nr:hypothetical protein [Azospirillum thermophilum]AWK88781.1 hypothetical protein DEW08_22140 [Azospirillum thermophilum]